MASAIKQAEIVAQAIRYTLKIHGCALTENSVNEVWSEVATADTYGTSEKFWVGWIRDVEQRGTGEYWFKRVANLTIQKAA